MILTEPQIAFVDDILEQIAPLNRVLTEEMNVRTVTYIASLEENNFPEKPLESVRLLFLDLYYANSFDAYICAEWVARIIPPNTKYALVIWSKDTDMEDEVMRVLRETDYLPVYQESWQKTDFDLKKFDFSEKIHELISNISVTKEKVEVVFGEIIEIEEDGLLVNCLLDFNDPTFQLRKFDTELFEGINKSLGSFVKICIRTQPGTRVIDVFEEPIDLSEKFRVRDYFADLKDTTFYTEE
jgi:hypothetical protein